MMRLKKLNTPFWVGLLGGVIGSLFVVILLVPGLNTSIYAEWLSAIGTVGAVVYSLWITLGANKLKYELFVEQNIEKESFELSIINTGEKNFFYQVSSVYVIDPINEKNINYGSSVKYDMGTATIFSGEKIRLLEIPSWYLDELIKESKSTNHFEFEIHLRVQDIGDRFVYVGSRGGGLQIMNHGIIEWPFGA